MTGPTEEPLQEARSIDLYPLPEGWKWVTVSDAGAHQKNAIVDGPFGSNLKVSDYVDGGPVPVLTTKNLDGKYDNVRYITKEKFEELKRSAVYPGDILMAKIGSCGKTGIYPPNNPPAMIPTNLLKVSLNDQFELKYVYYYFNSSFFQKALRTITKATAQPAFGVTSFRKLPLPYATRDQQRLIVAEIEKQFSRLDEAVALLKRTKANLKRYKAAVLKAAVEGKLTEDWRKQHPDVEPASKLLERILTERSKKWRGKGKYKEPAGPHNAELPSLPTGWAWATVEQLASGLPGSIQSGPFGSHLLHSEFVEKGVLAIGIDNILDGKFSLGSQHRIAPKKFEVLRKFEARPRDVVITVMATVGRVCVLPQNLERAIITKHCYRITPTGEAVGSNYLAMALRAESSTRQHIFGNVRGQTRPGINGAILKAAPVALPPPREQQQIVAEVERHLSVIDGLEATVQANLTRAERLRQSILSDAFAGRLG